MRVWVGLGVRVRVSRGCEGAGKPCLTGPGLHAGPWSWSCRIHPGARPATPAKAPPHPARHAHPATPARHAGAGRSHPGSSPQIWLPAPVRNRGITPPMGLT